MSRPAIVLAIAVAMLSAPATAADTYLTVGLGQGYLRHSGENMWWIQDGWDYYIKERSNIFSLAIGHEVTPWLSVELGYNDLGTYEHFAGFIIQEEQYNPATQECFSTCPNTRWGYMSGNVYSYSFSVLPRLRLTQNLYIFGRYGVHRYHAKFKAYLSAEDPKGRRFEENDQFTQWGTAVLWGAGITYERLSLEWTYFPTIHGDYTCCSAYRDADRWQLTYRWDF